MKMTAQFNDAFGKAVQGVMTLYPNLTPKQAQGEVANLFGQMGVHLTKGVETTYSDTTADLDVPQITKWSKNSQGNFKLSPCEFFFSVIIRIIFYYSQCTPPGNFHKFDFLSVKFSF